ncbi:hypothetical protein MEO41_27875 [Dolichospermum sp. ST_sed4]|nr:hypothetical protein [Dolichospermum sp. ST_sed4]
MLNNLPVENVRIEPVLTYYDKRENSRKILVRLGAKILSVMLGGNRVGWFLTVQFNKQ